MCGVGAILDRGETGTISIRGTGRGRTLHTQIFGHLSLVFMLLHH